MVEATAVRNQVFVSYSHADEEFLKRLRQTLSALERRKIKVWTDKDIAPGMKWRDEITAALAKTKVAVLMISTDFLSSDFIQNQELPKLLAAARTDGVAILPVIVKPSVFGDIELEPLSCYQAVNMGRPLAKLKDDAERDEEFVRILQEIRKHMEGEPRPTRQAPMAASAPAGSDEPEDEPDAEPDADSDEPLPVTDRLRAVLDAMLADPRAQTLWIQAEINGEAVPLMQVAEGRDGGLLLEVRGNDELPQEFRLNRQKKRDLEEKLGFNPPEIRGDRFWCFYEQGDDGEIDLDGVTEHIMHVLEDIFDLPAAAAADADDDDDDDDAVADDDDADADDADVRVVWQVLEL